MGQRGIRLLWLLFVTHQAPYTVLRERVDDGWWWLVVWCGQTGVWVDSVLSVSMCGCKDGASQKTFIYFMRNS